MTTPPPYNHQYNYDDDSSISDCSIKEILESMNLAAVDASESSSHFGPSKPGNQHSQSSIATFTTFCDDESVSSYDEDSTVGDLYDFEEIDLILSDNLNNTRNVKEDQQKASEEEALQSLLEELEQKLDLDSGSPASSPRRQPRSLFYEDDLSVDSLKVHETSCRRRKCSHKTKNSTIAACENDDLLSSSSSSSGSSSSGGVGYDLPLVGISYTIPLRDEQQAEEESGDTTTQGAADAFRVLSRAPIRRGVRRYSSIDTVDSLTLFHPSLGGTGNNVQHHDEDIGREIDDNDSIICDFYRPQRSAE